jgi:hypothetical protein
MDPHDGRFNPRPPGRLLGLAALVGLVLCSCGGEPPPESSAHPNLAVHSDTVRLEEGSREFPPVDSIITIIEDLTGDGEADSLELRVFGLRMEDPFEWTVRIWVAGEIVFEHQAIDSAQDRHFGELGYAGNSGNREQDKAGYYFDFLPGNLFHRAQRGPESAIFDRNSFAGVYHVLPRELKERGLVDDGTVQEIIEQVAERLQAGTVVIMIPRSPVLSHFPRIYIEQLGEFVPFVEW